MIQRILGIFAILTLASTAFAQSENDALKQRILAHAQSMSADDYAFTRTSRTDQTSGGPTEHTVTVEKYDPAKQGDARWTLVSINNAPPPPEDLKEYQKNSAKRRVPGYYRLATYFGAPATTARDARGRTMFRFRNPPKGTVVVFDSEISQNATIEASVNEGTGAPFVEQVCITVAPMRLKLIMKLESYESVARYRLGPEGKPLLVEQTTDVTGSGMGKQGKVHTVTTYGEFHPVNTRH